jgi:hypothetical protein
VKITERGRRTTLVTLGPDTVRLCWPECHKEFVSDLGVTDTRRKVGKPRTVRIKWLSRDFLLAWIMERTNSKHCDLCGDGWVAFRNPRTTAVIPAILMPVAASGDGAGISPPGIGDAPETAKRAA